VLLCSLLRAVCRESLSACLRLCLALAFLHLCLRLHLRTCVCTCACVCDCGCSCAPVSVPARASASLRLRLCLRVCVFLCSRVDSVSSSACVHHHKVHSACVCMRALVTCVRGRDTHAHISLPHGRLSPFYPSLTPSRAHYTIPLSLCDRFRVRTDREPGRFCSIRARCLMTSILNPTPGVSPPPPYLC